MGKHRSKPRNKLLIGPSGAGKSTVLELGQLKRNREKRGDDKAKIDETEESFYNWVKIARDNYWRDVDSAGSYVKQLGLIVS